MQPAEQAWLDLQTHPLLKLFGHQLLALNAVAAQVAAVPKATPEPFAPAHATQRAEGALPVNNLLSAAHPDAAK